MATLTKKRKRRSIDFKFNLSIYFSFLKKYWPSISIMLFAVLFTQASRVADKYLFKTLVDRGTEFTANIISNTFFVEILISLAVIFGLLTVGRFAFKWIQNHLLARLNTRMMRDLKVKFFNHIIGLSYDFHTSHRTGSLISRLIRGGNAVDRMNDVLIFNITPLIFQIIVAGASLIYFDWTSALVIVIISVGFIMYSWYINRIQEPSRLKSNEAEDREKGEVSDMFTNVESIRYFGKETRVKAKYHSFAEKTRNALRTNWDYFRWFDSVQGLILGLGTILIILFPILRFLEGSITIGTVVFIYTVYVGLMGPMYSFVWGLRGYYRAMADFQDLFLYAKIENEVKDVPNAKKLKVSSGAVEFNEVDFGYKRRPIFKKLSLKIPKNKKVALVGPS